MGLLDRLLSRMAPPSNVAQTASTIDATLYEGHETLEVVGESHYQDTLWGIVGSDDGERVSHDTLALLMPEPDNAYDSNAVMVLIGGNLVGYLSR
jgi:hypothetical protein